MSEAEHVTVIIPAYNEEATIAGVVADFKARAGVVRTQMWIVLSSPKDHVTGLEVRP